MNELEKLQTGLIYNDFDEDLFQIRNMEVVYAMMCCQNIMRECM